MPFTDSIEPGVVVPIPTLPFVVSRFRSPVPMFNALVELASCHFWAEVENISPPKYVLFATVKLVVLALINEDEVPVNVVIVKVVVVPTIRLFIYALFA